MRTLATKQPTNASAKQNKSGEKGRSRNPSPLSTGIPLLQRQCACGRGCPRCKEELGIQTKLKISEPGDQYEQEADRVADQVMQLPEPTITVQPSDSRQMTSASQLQIQRASSCGKTLDGTDLGPTNKTNRRGKVRKRPRLCKEKWDTSRLELALDKTDPDLRAINKGAITFYQPGDPLTKLFSGCSADCFLFRQFVKVKSFEEGIQYQGSDSCGQIIPTGSNAFIEERVNCITSRSGDTSSWNDKPGIQWIPGKAIPQFAKFDFTVRVMIWDTCLGIPKKALEGRIILFKDGLNKQALVTPFKEINVKFPFISPFAKC
jgi:hypothetical protein